MAWRFVREPNEQFKLYARFSEVVDDFTHFHMTEDEAAQYCKDEHRMDDASIRNKLRSANLLPERYKECLLIIAGIHGQEAADKVRQEIEGFGK